MSALTTTRPPGSPALLRSILAAHAENGTVLPPRLIPNIPISLLRELPPQELVGLAATLKRSVVKLAPELLCQQPLKKAQFDTSRDGQNLEHRRDVFTPLAIHCNHLIEGIRARLAACLPRRTSGLAASEPINKAKLRARKPLLDDRDFRPLQDLIDDGAGLFDLTRCRF